MSDPCVSAIQHDLCAAIICHNDELSSTLSWLEIVSWQSATRYVKVQIMEIKEILVRIWFISANEIKKTLNLLVNNQFNSNSNSSVWQIIAAIGFTNWVVYKTNSELPL